MQDPPIKICPQCQQPAPADALACLGCGNAFKLEPAFPIQTPPEARPTSEPAELPFNQAPDIFPNMPGNSPSSPGYPAPGGMPSQSDALPPQSVDGGLNPTVAGQGYYGGATPGAWQPGQQPPPQQSFQPPPAQQPWQPGQQLSQPPQQPWQAPSGQPAPPDWAAQQSSAQSNRTTIALLAIFLGPFGIHKFMMGMKTPALIMLLATVLTCGIGSMVTGLIGLVEGIIYLGKSDADFYSTYIVGGKEWF